MNDQHKEEAAARVLRRDLLREIFVRHALFKYSVLTVAIIFAAIEYANSTDKSLLPFQISIIFTLIIFLGEMLFEAREEQREIKDKIASEAEHLNNKVRTFGAVLEIREWINKNRNATGSVLRRLHDEAEGQLTLLKNGQGFLIRRSHWFSLIAYSAFWEELIDAQEHSPKVSGHGLTVLVVHGTPIDLWLNPSFAQQLADQQIRFTDAGGIIKRILCGHGAHPNAKESNVAQSMSMANVWVKYYNLDKGHYNYDFMFVCEWNSSVVWNSVSAQGTIRESVYLNSGKHDDRDDLRKNWDELARHSTDFPNFFDGKENKPFMES